MTIIRADARDVRAHVDDSTVAAVVTSPPYLEQRVYGADDRELGHEGSLKGYAHALADILDEVRHTMRPDALLWLNLGDKANGSGGAGGDWSSRERAGGPRKFADPDYLDGGWLDVPGAVTAELLHRGWRLRMPIVWNKVTQAPESLAHVRRPRPQHEIILMLAPGAGRYRFYPSMLAETGSVWTFPAGGSGPAHLAPFPDELARRCIVASTLPGDLVLDPFSGSGTTGRVARAHGRTSVELDLYGTP